MEGTDGSGIGESVLILTQRPVHSFTIINGFARTASLFERNNRVKSLGISFVAGFTGPGMVSETDHYLYFVKEFPAGENGPESAALPGAVPGSVPAAVEVKDTPDPQTIALPISPKEQREYIAMTLKDFAKDHEGLFDFLLTDLGIRKDDYTSPENVRLISEMYGFIALKITITGVYKGSMYDDTCISEIRFDLEDL